MRSIPLSEDVYHLVQRVAQMEFPDPGQKIASNCWELPVADDRYELLEAMRLPGESFSTLIVRVLRDRLCA